RGSPTGSLITETFLIFRLRFMKRTVVCFPWVYCTGTVPWTAELPEQRRKQLRDMKRCKFQLNLLLTLSMVMTVMTEAMAQQDRPNVLFIVVDDLNDWIGALNGHPQAKTPNLDRLAKKGVLFANAHAQAPLCNPS